MDMTTNWYIEDCPSASLLINTLIQNLIFRKHIQVVLWFAPESV